jgi:hypothetical protein
MPPISRKKTRPVCLQARDGNRADARAMWDGAPSGLGMAHDTVYNDNSLHFAIRGRREDRSQRFSRFRVFTRTSDRQAHIPRATALSFAAMLFLGRRHDLVPLNVNRT